MDYIKTAAHPSSTSHLEFYDFRSLSHSTVLILNTEIWARSVLGGLLREFQQLLRPLFILGHTVRLCRRGAVHAPWRSDGFAVCAVSRHRLFCTSHRALSLTRNGANRKRLAIFPFQPHAVALLRLSAPINQMRAFPRPLTTVNNAETRDLGYKDAAGARPADHTPMIARPIIPRFHMPSAHGRAAPLLHCLHYDTADTVGQSLQIGYGRRSC